MLRCLNSQSFSLDWLRADLFIGKIESRYLV